MYTYSNIQQCRQPSQAKGSIRGLTYVVAIFPNLQCTVQLHHALKFAGDVRNMNRIENEYKTTKWKEWKKKL